MKHIQVEETWINSNSSRYPTIDETYYPQWEHLRDQHYLGFVTIYIKTIVAE